MPDQPHSFEQQQSVQGESAWGRHQIGAAIAALDQATRIFTQQVGALQGSSSAPKPQLESDQGPAGIGGDQPTPQADPTERPRLRHDPETAFEERMRSVEREAREYLERAKYRADSLVNSMISAVEREAATMRQDAESGIRERWRAIELEAGRYLEDAKRVADGMVVERQQRISSLSDGLVERAGALTAGMDDAVRIRRQFDLFVGRLAETAGQLAEQPAANGEGEPSYPGTRPNAARQGPLAA